MKKSLRSLFSSSLVLGTIVLFSACSGSDDEVPSNVVEDASGIKIDLDWTTGGSAADALNQADLDLEFWIGTTKVDGSEFSSSYERIVFDKPDAFADGVYVVKVILYKADKDVNYTVTINGVTVTKPYTFTSNFDSEDDGRTIDVIKITKAGKKYTMVPA